MRAACTARPWPPSASSGENGSLPETSPARAMNARPSGVPCGSACTSPSSSTNIWSAGHRRGTAPRPACSDRTSPLSASHWSSLSARSSNSATRRRWARRVDAGASLSMSVMAGRGAGVGRSDALQSARRARGGEGSGAESGRITGWKRAGAEPVGYSSRPPPKLLGEVDCDGNGKQRPLRGAPHPRPLSRKLRGRGHCCPVRS